MLRGPRADGDVEVDRRREVRVEGIALVGRVPLGGDVRDLVRRGADGEGDGRGEALEHVAVRVDVRGVEAVDDDRRRRDGRVAGLRAVEGLRLRRLARRGDVDGRRAERPEVHGPAGDAADVQRFQERREERVRVAGDAEGDLRVVRVAVVVDREGRRDDPVDGVDAVDDEAEAAADVRLERRARVRVRIEGPGVHVLEDQGRRRARLELAGAALADAVADGRARADAPARAVVAAVDDRAVGRRVDVVEALDAGVAARRHDAVAVRLVTRKGRRGDDGLAEVPDVDRRALGARAVALEGAAVDAHRVLVDPDRAALAAPEAARVVVVGRLRGRRDVPRERRVGDGRVAAGEDRAGLDGDIARELAVRDRERHVRVGPDGAAGLVGAVLAERRVGDVDGAAVGVDRAAVARLRVPEGAAVDDEVRVDVDVHGAAAAGLAGVLRVRAEAVRRVALREHEILERERPVDAEELRLAVAVERVLPLPLRVDSDVLARGDLNRGGEGDIALHQDLVVAVENGCVQGVVGRDLDRFRVGLGADGEEEEGREGGLHRLAGGRRLWLPRDSASGTRKELKRILHGLCLSHSCSRSASQRSRTAQHSLTPQQASPCPLST